MRACLLSVLFVYDSSQPLWRGRGAGVTVYEGEGTMLSDEKPRDKPGHGGKHIFDKRTGKLVNLFMHSCMYTFSFRALYCCLKALTGHDGLCHELVGTLIATIFRCNVWLMLVSQILPITPMNIYFSKR